MKEQDSKRAAMERLLERLRQWGGDFSSFMRALDRAPGEEGALPPRERDAALADFEVALAEVLRENAHPPMRAPAALPGKPTEEDVEDWKKFEAELEQRLIRKFNL